MAVDTFIAYVGVYSSLDDAEFDYEFIKDLRVNATMEPSATCGTSSQNYVTKTGPDPSNLGESAAPAPAGT